MALKEKERPLLLYRQPLLQTFLSPYCFPKTPWIFLKETYLFFPQEAFSPLLVSPKLGT